MKTKFLLLLFISVSTYSQISKEEIESIIKPNKIDRVYLFNSNLQTKYEISPRKISDPGTKISSTYLEITSRIENNISYMPNGLKVKSKHTTYYIPYVKIKLIAVENYLEFQYLNIELDK